MMHALAIAFVASLGAFKVAMFRAMHRSSSDFDKLVAKLTEELGRPPTDDELRAFGHDVPEATLRQR